MAAIVAGLFAGFSALVPFVHANLVLAFSNSVFSPESAAVFAVVLSFSRLPWEALASVFFAIPSPGQNASVLPAHRLVLAGDGLAALRTTLSSFALSLFCCVLLLPLALFLVPFLYSALRLAVPFILLCVVLVTVFSEHSRKNALLGLFVFMLSGSLGFSVLSFPTVNEPLFPLLTGLFGFSSLFLAVSENERPPAQRDLGPSVDRKMVFAGVLLGLFSGLLPAVTPAFLASAALFFFEAAPLQFLSLNASIVFSKLFFDFAAAATIGKARSGAAAAVLGAGSPSVSFLAILLALGAGAFLLHAALVFSTCRAFSKGISSLNSRNFNLALLAFLSVSVLLVSGPVGLFIASTAACVGLLPALLKIRRAYSLGALMVPTLLYYSGLNYALVSLVR